MSEFAESSAHDESAEAADESASARLAIERCSSAWSAAYDACLQAGEHEYTAAKVAAEAYRGAMPALSGARNVCDFIACAAHAILIGALEGKQGSQLLYAAQVASCAVNRERKSQPRKGLRSRRRAT